MSWSTRKSQSRIHTGLLVPPRKDTGPHQFTCDLAVEANKAGDVPVSKLPFHSWRSVAGVGAG